MTRRRIIRYSIVGLLGLLAIGLIASWVVAGRLVAPASRVIGNPPPDLPAISISLASQSGSTVAGWHIPAKTANGVVILLHGIHGSRLSVLNRARLLHSRGYSIVMIDLQAHGESPGAQITVGHLEKHDVRAAVEFARNEHPGERIGILGISLGGASAVLASPLEIDALVLESVYPAISNAVHNRVAAQLGALSPIPAEILLVQLKLRLGIERSQLRPIDHLPDIDCPVFVMSGTDDRHTTADETREMFSVAREPKEVWLVDGAAHVDLYQASQSEYETRLLRFLGRYLRNSR